MRTTVTMDDDLVASLQQLAYERGTTFKEVLNATVRAGLRPATAERTPYRLPTRAMHRRPAVDLDRALSLAAGLEDTEVVRKLELRK